MENFFIQPFDIAYQKYKRYIYIAIDGNRIFKEFYIITDTKVSGKIMITVIAVKNDKKVVAYINDEDEYEKNKKSSHISAVYYSEIKMLTNDSRNLQYLKLFFRTENNETVEFELFSLKKPYRKKNAIRARESFYHNTESTIFYTGKRLKFISKSTVNITGKPYNIKRKRYLRFILGKPIMNYVQDLGVINIFNKESKLKVIKLPQNIVKGEKFVYEINGKEIKYIIEKIVDDNLFISSGNEKIIAKKTDKGIELFKLFITMHTEAPEITFYPPIPIFENKEPVHSQHKASLTMGTSTVMGDVNYYGWGDKGFEIFYTCPLLEWTQDKPFGSSMEKQSDGTYILKSGITENKYSIENHDY